VQKIVIYNRNDSCGDGCRVRLSNAVVSLLDENDSVIGRYQLGDMTSTNRIDLELSDFDIQAVISHCTCLYPNGMPPSRELVPIYAKPSPPKFTLVNSNGMALGLIPNVDCNTLDDLTIETQLSDPSSPRQQFKITQDGRVVSVRCPDKVLTPALDENGDCSTRIGLHLSFASFDANINSSVQRWKFNDGSITNVKCPILAISSNKDKDATLSSVYFALQNPRTQLAVAVKETTGDDCSSGTLEMQAMVYGKPNQQFLYIESESKIVSLLCPTYAVTIPDNGNCETTSGLRLSDESFSDARNQWSFSDDGIIQSLKCTTKFITIDGALSGGARAVSLSTDQYVQTSGLPAFKNDTKSTSTAYTNATYGRTEWEEASPPNVGSALVLSDVNAERYQKWTKQHQVNSLLLLVFSSNF
jgi:hypothetical protein